VLRIIKVISEYCIFHINQNEREIVTLLFPETKRSPENFGEQMQEGGVTGYRIFHRWECERCTMHLPLDSISFLYLKFMTFWFYIGIAAAALTMFGFIPQIVRMYQTGSVHDISVLTLLQFTLGMTLWALYGFYINDAIVIGANLVSLTTLIVALGLFYHYHGTQGPGIPAEER